jgi:diaminopimelate epimerase
MKRRAEPELMDACAPDEVGTRPLTFHKMHGAGNDFVLIDARGTAPAFDPGQAARIADRQRGVGCDQILVLRESRRTDCLLRYEIWNADGSPAGQCGNGARCIGLYLERNGETGSVPFTLESPAGPVSLQRCADGDYEIDMGTPEFRPERVPLDLPAANGGYALDSPWGRLELGAVSMGNPHALLLVDDIGDARIGELGAFIGAHDAFPEGCNAGFAQVVARDRIQLRVVERGAGETLACGSGACAAVAVLRRAGLVDACVEVVLPGGRLVIKWPGPGKPLRMKGPAVYVFRGTLDG